jgi:hypothetical protein
MMCDVLITLRARIFGRSDRAASATAVILHFKLLLLLLLLLASIKPPQSLVSALSSCAPAFSFQFISIFRFST